MTLHSAYHNTTIYNKWAFVYLMPVVSAGLFSLMIERTDFD